MSMYPGFVSAGAEFVDPGFFEADEADKALREALLQFTTYGDGYEVFGEPVMGGLGGEGEFFEQAFGGVGSGGVERMASPSLASLAPLAPLAPPAPSSPSPLPSPPSPTPSEAPSAASAVSLTNSLDDAAATALHDTLTTAPTAPTSSTYTPDPLILASQPAFPPDLNGLYTPITTSRFATAATAKAYRTRARLPRKSAATDVAKVKAFGRDYWVCRLYNAMIDSTCITDGEKSVHRTRFTEKRVFEAGDLEAAAHAVFDEALAVHERGWNVPRAYHKHTVRGKLVDISGASVELRLSRLCHVLRHAKSAVDDALRGGITLALLCDNPEARNSTKTSNNEGNRVRGERLRQTRTKKGMKRKKATRGVVAEEEQVVEEVIEEDEDVDDAQVEDVDDAEAEDFED